MKVVINKCFGGFSLSAAAVKRLAELKGKPCYFFKHDYKTNKYISIDGMPDQGKFADWTAFTIPNPNEYFRGDKSWKEMTQDERIASNRKHDEVELTSRPENRQDPDLVQVVKELGRKADGSCAVLKIVEIPDSVPYEIDEYDGMESVHEVHKVWR